MLPFTGNKAMRDALIEKIYEHMRAGADISFLSADFGAPSLDKIRKDFPRNFASVGIAEQDLVNVAAGMAYEGGTVFAYAISAFLTMRAFEQIKINFSLHAKHKRFNAHLIGVGAGLSYDISGPSHHCLEDISIINTLPDIVIFSPSDSMMVRTFYDQLVSRGGCTYHRFDSKPLPQLYSEEQLTAETFKNGFIESAKGADICLVSTGFMTHQALKVRTLLKEQGINAGILDVHLLNAFDEQALKGKLEAYGTIITMEEGFVNKGGFDSIIKNLLLKHDMKQKIRSFGFTQGYVFTRGNRDILHKSQGLAPEQLAADIKKLS